MSNTLRIGGATVNQTPLDWTNNVTNIIAAIEDAKRENVRILCFPELSLTGYGCEDLFLSDWLSERAWSHLQEIIPHCDSITACIGLPVRIDGITYNGVCIIQNKKIIGLAMGKYGKISRVLGLMLGSYLTYAPLKLEEKTAEGQITVSDLKNIWQKLNSKS